MMCEPLGLDGFLVELPTCLSSDLQVSDNCVHAYVVVYALVTAVYLIIDLSYFIEGVW